MRIRGGMCGRRLGACLSVLAFLAATLVVATPEAWASADGCDNYGNNPKSCVQVQGSGTYVDWARGGVTLAARGSTRGHFDIWWDGGSVTTPDETLSNDSFIAHTKWGQTVAINGNLPNGSKVCASFFQLHSDGSYGRKGEACVGIG
jgi:hypothetical protein